MQMGGAVDDGVIVIDLLVIRAGPGSVPCRWSHTILQFVTGATQTPAIKRSEWVIAYRVNVPPQLQPHQPMCLRRVADIGEHLIHHSELVLQLHRPEIAIGSFRKRPAAVADAAIINMQHCETMLHQQLIETESSASPKFIAHNLLVGPAVGVHDQWNAGASLHVRRQQQFAIERGAIGCLGREHNRRDEIVSSERAERQNGLHEPDISQTLATGGVIRLDTVST